MKLIIAGSRTLCPSYDEITKAVIEFSILGSITEVVSGTARGVDTAGESWAELYLIPIKRFPADWDLHGKKAGHLRNIAMAKYADALLVFWDGQSRGTKDMVDIARFLHMPTYIVKP